jgi:sugar/nucleoside kinase (ribokinase family)
MVEQGYLQKLFEVYFMKDDPLDEDQRAEIDELVRERVRSSDVTVVTDFGHGLIDPSTVEILCREARFLAVNAQSNSGNHGYNLITKYPRADFICIDAPEARLAAHDRFNDIGSIIESRLRTAIDCPNMIVTHGSHGCYPYTDGRGVGHVPAFTKQVVDTVGAGDAFFVVAAPLMAAGGSIEDVAFVGNAAGAMKVGIVGHRSSVEKAPLLKYVTRLLK